MNYNGWRKVLYSLTGGARARGTAYLNLITNSGLLVGGVAGALMVGIAPDRVGSVTLAYSFWSLLIISFLLRLGTVVIFLPRFREVRNVPPVGLVEMLFFAAHEVPEAAGTSMTGVTDEGGEKAGRD